MPHLRSVIQARARCLEIEVIRIPSCVLAAQIYTGKCESRRWPGELSLLRVRHCVNCRNQRESAECARATAGSSGGAGGSSGELINCRCSRLQRLSKLPAHHRPELALAVMLVLLASVS
jgi:hypothetical protein